MGDPAFAPAHFTSQLQAQMDALQQAQQATAAAAAATHSTLQQQQPHSASQPLAKGVKVGTKAKPS